MAHGVVIGLAGHAGVGKTSLANRLASALAWPHVGFGSYVRLQAKARSLPEDRATLQGLGASLIKEMGWNEFCLAVLGQASFEPGSSLVLDGIRHVDAVLTLRQVVRPSRFLCVGLEVSPIVLSNRLGDEHLMVDAPSLRHSTEVEVDTLLHDYCDVVVNGERSIEDLVKQVVDALQELEATND